MCVNRTVDLLDGIDLVVFDKDGTLIEFHRMWRAWVGELGDRLAAATGRALRDATYRLMGVDESTGKIDPHGLFAATPMPRLRELVRAMLVDDGIGPAAAEAALATAWDPPDPVALATPTTDLPALLEGLRRRGVRAAVATSDDRGPTERTLAALGIDAAFETLVCADDGLPGKPAPDAVLRIAAQLAVNPERILVIGDAPADMRMARAAGAGRVVGVLSGVGDEATLAPLADVVVPSIAALAPDPRGRPPG